MDWVAESVSKDTYVHIMEQYRPEFTVGKGEKRARSGFTKYEEIDRPVNDTEMQIVQVSGETDTLKKHLYCLGKILLRLNSLRNNTPI